jgi:hypothetical protein
MTFPIVKVVWIDSEREASGWTRLEEIKDTLTEIETVGFLYKDTDILVSLIQTMDSKALSGDIDGDVLYAINIPRGCVKSITKL